MPRLTRGGITPQRIINSSTLVSFRTVEREVSNAKVMGLVPRQHKIQTQKMHALNALG